MQSALCAVRDVFKGMIDAIAWWRAIPLLQLVEDARVPVIHIMTVSFVLLFGQIANEHVLVPIASFLFGGRSPLFDWMFYLCWTLPMLILGMLLNVGLYQDLTHALIKYAKNPNPIPTKRPMIDQVSRSYHAFFRGLAEEVMRLLLVFVASTLAQTVWTHTSAEEWSGVFVRSISFAYIAWIQALHLFDHLWVIQGRTFYWKVQEIEQYPAYYFGFGMWMASLIVFWPTYLSCGMYYSLMPGFMLASVFRAPRTTTRCAAFRSSWPLFRCFLPPIGFLLSLIDRFCCRSNLVVKRNG